MSYLEVLLKNNESTEIFKKYDKLDPEVEDNQLNDESKNDESKSDESTYVKKNYVRKKYVKKSQEPKDPNFLKAIKLAQEKLINMCKPISKDEDTILEAMKYIRNWEGYRFEINITEDIMKFKVEEKEYEFSKRKLLQNKYFQRELSYYYVLKYGSVYLNFYESKNDENIFIIHIKSKKR